MDNPTIWRYLDFTKYVDLVSTGELRAIVYAVIEDRNGMRLSPPDERGIRLKVSLSNLIAAVYVAPTAPDWFYALVARISKNFDVMAPVIRPRHLSVKSRRKFSVSHRGGRPRHITMQAGRTLTKH